MSEFKRVYSRRGFIIALLMVLNAGLFLMTSGGENMREVTLTGDELAAYIASYPDFIKRTQENAERLLALPMYKNDDFAAESIIKTARDHERLSGTELVSGDNRGTVILLQYHLTDMLLTALLGVIAMGFHAERRKGLVYMIRGTALGRGRLCFVRIGLLAVSAAGAGCVLYGSDFLVMCAAFGRPGLSRALQSLPEFMECPYGVTLGEFLLISAAFKIAAAFAVSLFIYLLTSIFGTAAAFSAAGIWGVGELLLYTLLPAVSGVRGLKYINIFAAFDVGGIFRSSRYINVSGNAVPALSCLIFSMLLFILFMSAALMTVHGRGYFGQTGNGDKVTEIMGKLREKFPVNTGLAGWELRKILINCRGIFFILAAFLLTLSAAGKYGYSYPVDPYEIEWYEKFQGVITEEMTDNIALYRSRLEKGIERTNEQIAACMERDPVDGELLGRLTLQLEEYEHRLRTLLPVEENAFGGLRYTKATGNEVMLIKPYSYELLLKKDMGSVRRASLYSLMGIIAAVSGVYAYDRQNSMGHIISASFKGRGNTHGAKLFSVSAVCAAVCISLHLIQLLQINDFMGFADLTAPLQSLECMRGFPVYMSVRVYLILLFAVRCVMGCMAGFICAGVSRLSPDTGTAKGISVFLLAVPSMMSEALGSGFPDMVCLLGGEFFM